MEPIKLGQTFEENVQEIVAGFFLVPITMWPLLRAPRRCLQAVDLTADKPVGERLGGRPSPALYFLFPILTIARVAAAPASAIRPAASATR